MLFNQLNIGDKVYIIEVVGTFKKTTEYNEGSVTQVSSIYDEPLPPGQFPMPNQPRKRIVDITIQCNGETKKFTIPENKSVITDNSIGLTISTDKQIQYVINTIRTNKEKKLQLNAMKKWLSVRLYQISLEQIMNQLKRMIR